MSKVRFSSLRLNQKFSVSGKWYKKTKRRFAPKRGYLISNAVTAETGVKALFGAGALVEVTR